MPQINITGQTYNHREMLKALGAKWDGECRHWSMAADDQTIMRLRGVVGVQVEIIKPRAQPTPIADNVPISSEPVRVYTIDDTDSTHTPEAASTSGETFGNDQTYHDHFRQRNTKVFYGFDNLAALVDAVKDVPAHVQNDRVRNDGWSQPKSFTGTEDMNEAIDLALNGWCDGVTQAAEYMEMLTVSRAKALHRTRGVVGSSVNVGRMLAGQPDHMIKRSPQPGRKVVTFFVEAAANYNIKSEILIMRAAIIAAIVDLMERAGYSCDIVSVITIRDNHMKSAYQSTCVLKSAGERLNLSDVIFGLGHPSYFRRLNFALLGASEQLRHIWHNFGIPDCAFDDDHRCRKSEFYIPPMDSVTQARVKGDPVRMLRAITPDALPIKIEDDD